MEVLGKMYEQPSAAKKVHLVKILFNLMLHLSEFNTIVDQLISVNITFDDEVQALLILSQLPDSWVGCVIVISNSVGKEKLKLSEVVSMIISEEVRRKSSKSKGSVSILNFKQRGRSQKKDNQNKK
ncbi:uncharacterized protein A4U43_C04F32830 [Asparagus officinalis]|uniref:Uncharacterized protein n=1 Tax=Asparagus officinalis TaxID=4686 RepID=A0A5P1F623_ASPOF|nr:uncharacterized protein A4U43_C04F32830 [Asparagus officinalis]